jgi:hypothetical protein
LAHLPNTFKAAKTDYQSKMAAAANASQSKNLYNLTPYGRAYVITCADPNACDFYDQKYLTIAKDETMERQAFWSDTHNGWIVRGRDVDYAKAFVDYLNQQQETTAEEMEVAETLATMGDLDDEADVELAEDEDLFTLTQHGRGYLIECNDPKQTSWWGEKYLALSEVNKPGIAYWNKTLEAYVVRGRDVEEAEYFVHRANHPENRTTTPKTSLRPIRIPREAPPAPQRTTRRTRTFPLGESQRFTRSVARRLFEAEQEPRTDEQLTEEVMEDEDLFTLTQHGRGYLIECNDPSQCAFFGNRYIALSDTEEPGVAFWDDRLSGWFLSPEYRKEAEYFVHQANHPENRTTTPKTPSRPIRTPPTTPPAPPRKTRTFPLGESQRFTRSVARRLFEEGAVWGGEEEPRTEDQLAGEVMEDEDDTSDEDYVPSEDEEDSEDDDELFEEATTSDGPYVGMTLRTSRRGPTYLTCAASHRLHGSPYLGFPAANMTSRPNCWEVQPGSEAQFVEGGARFEE